MKKHSLPVLNVKYKGLFDFDRLYKFVYKWLRYRKYRTQEDKYKTKPDTVQGYEHEIRILGEKKVDEFYEYHMKVLLHGRDCKEVNYNGKTLTEGRIKVTLMAWVISDYQGKFEGSKIKEFLEDIYTGYIIDREMGLNHLDPMHYGLHDFQEEIKKILNMYADVNYQN